MIRVLVPATSANCSIGFDSLGMALEWRSVFTFEESEEFKVTGCDPEFANENNLVVQAFRLTAQTFGKKMPVFHMHTETDIPLARGLGSSSACVVGGIEAANAWFDLKLSKEEMLKLAIVLEGHPDNAAPALMGGMTACFKIPDSKKKPNQFKSENNTDRSQNAKPEEAKDEFIHSLMDIDGFIALAVIPDYEVLTPEARKALPEKVLLQEAAAQIGRALVFREAITAGNEKLLYTCCEDVFHEPYRQKLIKEYGELKSLADQYEIPFWISGSGSTMLYLSKSVEQLEKVKEELKNKFPNFGYRILKPARKGALVEYV
ncbi:homoserine kinase [Ileibacterium valens]|uniref:homoserine kinase n=1 Tax=Ileibacterium valens TaxID=1862668 RepID=UPI002353A74A|nr:homoserine kinase [Ileibacterium valens]